MGTGDEVMFFVAPTEPTVIKQLIEPDGVVSLLPEKYGCDVLWFVGKQRWGVQRKELKDFIQSVGDGRLSKEIAQMRCADLGMCMVLIEGKINWSTEGELIWNTRGQVITRSQWRGMLWSIRNEGVHIDFTKDKQDTVEYIRMLGKWSAKEKHVSIMRRPGPANYWGSASNVDYAVHVLQGFDGIGLDRAKAIVQHFGGLPLSWDVSETDLSRVKGIGKVLAKKLVSALEKLDNTTVQGDSNAVE